ncbi:aryl-alcohol dehydrogenase, partial [Coniosporium uncinatum]
QTEDEVKISEALEKVAKEHNIESVTAVALAYVMSKTPNVFPIVGGRKVEHLKDNIQALKIKLSQEQIEFLESQRPFDPGFPTTMVGDDPKAHGGKVNFLLGGAAQYSFVQAEKAIGHE